MAARAVSVPVPGPPGRRTIRPRPGRARAFRPHPICRHRVLLEPPSPGGLVGRGLYPVLGYPGQGWLLAGVGRTIHTPEHRRLVQLLRQLREEAGLRQGELAERLDRPQSFVSKYESGERRIDLIELRDICVALGTTVARVVARWERK